MSFLYSPKRYPIEFTHEGLAEAHNLCVGFPFRVEVRAAFAAAHGKGGQRVLEDLLKSEELDDAEIDGRMETEAALVRSDSGVKLDTESAVDLDIALIVYPWDAEDDLALGLNDALEDACFDKVRAGIGHRIQSREDFADGLYEFRLVAVALLDGFHDLIQMLIVHSVLLQSVIKRYKNRATGRTSPRERSDPIAAHIKKVYCNLKKLSMKCAFLQSIQIFTVRKQKDLEN